MKTLFLAETRGGKYTLHAYETSSDSVMVESLTNGVIRGCMGPVTRLSATQWAKGRMADSAEIDQINYQVKLDLLNR